MVAQLTQWVVVFTGPILGVLAGVWVYRDAVRRGSTELAPFLGAAVGLVFLAGSVPALVALAVSADTVAQGFPTALRIIPGFAILGAYLLFRGRAST